MNKKIIIYIIIGVILLLVLYFIFTKRSTYLKDNVNNNFLDLFTAEKQEESTYPFKLGSRGKEVLAMQKAINMLYISKDMNANKPFPLDEDGIYGPLTQAAVIRYLGGTRGNIQGQVSFSEAKRLEKLYEMELKPQTT